MKPTETPTFRNHVKAIINAQIREWKHDETISDEIRNRLISHANNALKCYEVGSMNYFNTIVTINWYRY